MTVPSIFVYASRDLERFLLDARDELGHATTHQSWQSVLAVLVTFRARLTPAEVAGTDIAYAVPLTAIAAVGHWWLGSINWMLLATLLVGSVPGITLGSWAARAVPERFLRGMLAMTLATVAYKLIH